MEDVTSGLGAFILCAAPAACMIVFMLLCLKIKSTKKSPELLGTVGTVKRLDDDEPDSVLTKKSPRLRPVSSVIDVIHDHNERYLCVEGIL